MSAIFKVIGLMLLLSSCGRHAFPTNVTPMIDPVLVAEQDEVLVFSNDIYSLETTDGITVQLESEGAIDFHGPYALAGLSFARKNQPKQVTSGLGVFTVYGRQVLIENRGLYGTPELVVTLKAVGNEAKVLTPKQAVLLAVEEVKTRHLDFVGYSWRVFPGGNQNVLVMLPASDDTLLHYVLVDRISSKMIFSAMPVMALLGFGPAREAAVNSRWIDLEVTTNDPSPAQNVAVQSLHARILTCAEPQWPDKVQLSWPNGELALQGFEDSSVELFALGCLKKVVNVLEPPPEDIVLSLRFESTFVEEIHSGIIPEFYTDVKHLVPLLFHYTPTTPTLERDVGRQIRLSWADFIACGVGKPSVVKLRLIEAADGTILVEDSEVGECFTKIVSKWPIRLGKETVKLEIEYVGEAP